MTERLLRFARSSSARTRGAIDLASILVGVLVLGVLGGIISASVFVVIPWSQDAAARSSLDGLRTAQSVARVKDGSYLNLSGLVAAKYIPASTGVDVLANAAGDCFVAGSKSRAGVTFYSTSRGGAVLDDSAGQPDTSWCVPSGQLLADKMVNLATNPSFETAASGSDIIRTNYTTNPGFEADAAGWGINGGGAIGRSDAESHTGSASSTFTASTVDHGVRFKTAVPTTAGTAFTASAWVLAPVGSKLRIVADEYDSGTYLRQAQTVFTATGQWQRVSASLTMTTGDSIAQGVRIAAGSSGSVTFHTDDWLLERTGELGEHFDGATVDALGVDYGWAGTAGSSVSTGKAATAATRTNLLVNPSAEVNATTGVYPASTGVTLSQDGGAALSGRASFKVVTDGTATDQGIQLAGGVQTAGAFSASIRVRGSAGTVVYGVVRMWGADASDSNSPNLTLNGSWQQLTMSAVTITVPTTSDMTVMVRTRGVQAATFHVDDGIAEKSAAVGPYFDGASGAGADFVYAWTGAAGLSPSVQRGTVVNSGTTTVAATVQSSVWATRQGTKSLRISPTSNATDSSFNAFLAPLTPGKTYTLLATAHLSAPLTGPMTGRARSVIVDMHNDTGSGIIWFPFQTPAAPNSAGDHEVRATFTVPAGNSGNPLRIYNGSAAGGGDVWWDDLLVVEGAYAGPYFDGSTPGGGWNGPADASTSYAWVRQP